MNFLNYQGVNSDTFQGEGGKPMPVSMLQYIAHYAYGLSEPTLLRMSQALMDQYEGSKEGLKRKVLEKAIRMAQDTSEKGNKLVPHGIVLSRKATANLIDFVYYVEGYRGARMAVGPCICQYASKKTPPGVDEIEWKDLTLFYGADIYKDIPLGKRDLPLGHREVNAEEAKEIFEEMHERGYVHNAFYLYGKRSGLFVLCNCDKDLCRTVRGTRLMGPGLMAEKGPEVTVRDKTKCLGAEECGMCAKRCPFGASRIVNGEIVFDQSRCMGCELCVTTCKGHARQLVERKDYGYDHILNRTLVLAGMYGRPELEVVPETEEESKDE